MVICNLQKTRFDGKVDTLFMENVMVMYLVMKHLGIEIPPPLDVEDYRLPKS
jgi:hypothetical protein